MTQKTQDMQFSLFALRFQSYNNTQAQYGDPGLHPNRWITICSWKVAALLVPMFLGQLRVKIR